MTDIVEELASITGYLQEEIIEILGGTKTMPLRMAQNLSAYFRLTYWTLNHIHKDWFVEGLFEHGLPFLAWVNRVGCKPGEGDFEEAYEGCWSSIEEYAADYFDNSDMVYELSELPERVSKYLKVNLERLVEDIEEDCFTIEKPMMSNGVISWGDVWVFRYLS